VLTPFLLAAFIRSQAAETVAPTALILRSRYDIPPVLF